MKERPILFSAPMVRALLAGTKTQTRRAWREQPPAGVQVAYVPGETRSPYGEPGDRLWVREAHSLVRAEHAELCPVWYWADGNPINGDWTKPRPSIHMHRWASRITLEIVSVRVERLHAIWENDADCMAEGIEEMPPHPCGTRRWRNYLPGHPQAWSPNLCIPGNSFSTLWRSINGDESWDANPWVWVVEFKRVTADSQLSAG